MVQPDSPNLLRCDPFPDTALRTPYAKPTPTEAMLLAGAALIAGASIKAARVDAEFTTRLVRSLQQLS